MALSTMVPAVLAATAIDVLHRYSPYTTGVEDIFSSVWEDGVFANYSQALNASGTLMQPTGAALLASSNGTAAAAGATELPVPGREPWYVVLPLTLAVNIFMYYWLVGLERALPARPRRAAVVPSSRSDGREKTGGLAMSEDREEEVVKQWIAQGRVRRSSLSWFNTLAKWLLTLTVGAALRGVIVVQAEILGGRPSAPTRSTWTIPISMASGVIDAFVSFEPAALLLAFIFVPAPQRVVFVNAIEFLGNAFLVAALRIVVPWASKTDFVQVLITNMTEGLTVANERAAKERLLDEL